MENTTKEENLQNMKDMTCSMKQSQTNWHIWYILTILTQVHGNRPSVAIYGSINSLNIEVS